MLGAFFHSRQNVVRHPFGVADRNAIPVRFGSVDAERCVIRGTAQLCEAVVNQMDGETINFWGLDFVVVWVPEGRRVGGGR